MAAPKHILVTGGAGFIGSHLVERLLRDGHRVVAIDDCSTGSIENLHSITKNPAFRFIHSRVSACAELRAVVAESECIYHLAAAVGVDLVVKFPIRTIQTNLDETERVLESAAEYGVPVLLASTSEVYGKSQKAAFSEGDDLLIGPPHLGRWSYACSKLMDEFLGLAYSREKQLPVTIVRIFNTVGPRQTGRYGMVLPRFIQAAREGVPLKVFGTGRQSRCFCLVTDTVEALLRLHATTASRGEVFNVGSTEEVEILQLAKLVIDVLDSKSSIEFVPYNEAYSRGFEDMLRRKPVTDKLQRVTGFRPATSLRRIVELTAASTR